MMELQKKNCMLGLFAALLLATSPVTSQHHVHEAHLREAILSDGYRAQIRPERTVSIGVRFSMLAINQLHVPSQRMSVSGWLSVTWNDSRLSWDPASYGGIKDIYDTEEVFWRPQIIVDNAVDELGIISHEHMQFRASADGIMTWEPPGVLTTYCDVDVTYYPFDTQLCRVEVTSWSYTLREVNLHAVDPHVYLVDYEKNGEWDIIDTWTDRQILKDEADTHSQIDFHVKLRRKPAYYANTVLVPVVVTAFLCVLVFILPAESGKVGYSLTILLTYTVMLTLVSDLMPPTSKTTSVLSVYLTIILVIGVISCLLTMCVLFCHHHDDQVPLPPWLDNLNHRCLIKIGGWKRLKGDQPILDDDPISPNGLDIKWTEVAIILDKACFKVLGACVFMLTAIVLVVLLIGANLIGVTKGEDEDNY